MKPGIGMRLLCILSVPVFVILLGVIWIAETLTRTRYEGFLEGKECGSHKR